MRLTYIKCIVTVVALFCFIYADAQTKPAAKKATGKTVKPVAKKAVVTPATKNTAANAKKVIGIAKTVVDTTRRGGQTKTPAKPDQVSLSEEIVVTTAYKPVLADAVKIRRNPDLETKEPFKAPLTYNALDKSLHEDSEIKELPSMKIPKEMDSEVYSSYAKIGIGSFKTTFGEIYIDNNRDPALQVGGYLKHFAQNGSNFRQNSDKGEAGLFGKSIGEINTISGNINYQYRSNYFYGFDQVNPPSIVNVDKQHFNTLSGEAELTKNYQDEDNQFLYAIKLGGYAFSNAFQAKENNLVLSGYINETVNQFYTGLSGSIDVTTVKDSLYSFTNNIVRANPYIKFQGDNYKIDAGLNLVSEFGANTRFHVFPAVRLELQVIPKYVRLFAEVRGDVNKSSIREFSETNPFLGQNINIQNSVDKLDISAGLKGMLAPGLGFKATVYRKSISNMPLFVSNFMGYNPIGLIYPSNTVKGYNRFAVIYDGGTAKVNGFSGELDYKTSGDLDIFGKVDLKDYQLASEAQAWNLPKFTLTAGTTVRINSLVSVHGSVLFRGNTTDRISATQAVEVGSFADLSGGVEYKATKRLSVFGQVNNLLNNSYQSWLYYPNYGFNIFGGVGYKF